MEDIERSASEDSEAKSLDKEIKVENEFTVKMEASAKLPTKYGEFNIVAFTNDLDHKEHVALVKGDIEGGEDVPARVHSECLTGDVFGSLKCDCGEQLERALKEISNSDRGVILYMRQEGRGIGLANKIQAYSLQDEGLDTVEANKHLGFDNDLRDYSIAAAMFKLLGVENIKLYTNNPDKVEGLREEGIEITERCPIKVVPNPHNLSYLKTKKEKAGHIL